MSDTASGDFATLGLGAALLENLATLGYAQMTPIQSPSIAR